MAGEELAKSTRRHNTFTKARPSHQQGAKGRAGRERRRRRRKVYSMLTRGRRRRRRY